MVTCGDNRFEIIEKAKEDLMRRTNISSSPIEMTVLDNFLFRAWQMGWLQKYDVESTPTKEYILCAALKRKEPRDMSTNNFKTGTTEPDDIYFIEIGRRHNDILERFGKDVIDVHSQGFYTSFGRFVDRKEAMQIAMRAGQVNDVDIQLYSEDLY